METKYLNMLRCPGDSSDTGRCAARLELITEEPVPVFFAEIGNGDEDLQEGILCCTRCGTRYPVLCGVPLLIHPIEEYLRAQYYFLLGFSKEMSMPVSTARTVLAELAGGPANLPPPQYYDRRWSTRVAKYLSSYLINHHLGLENLPLLSEEHRCAIRAFRPAGGPHRVMLEMLESTRKRSGRPSDNTGLTLDVGCSVGGFTARLATASSNVLGVDVSFESLVLARELLKRRTGNESRITVFSEGDNRIHCAVEPLDGTRCEFFLASGSALPFSDNTFQTVASCNLVDVMDKPAGLLSEKQRVAVPEGTLLLSTPFLFTTSGVSQVLGPEGGEPVSILKNTLVALGMEIVAERDAVPWVVYHYRRRLDFYLVFCLAARIRPGGSNG